MQKNYRNKIYRWSVPIVGILLGLSYAFPYKLWAFSTIAVFPIWFQVFFWLSLASLVFPTTLRYIDRVLQILGGAVFVKYRSLSPFIIFMAGSGLMTLAWFDNMLLGDSNLVYDSLKNVRGDILFEHNRILSIYIYRGMVGAFSWLLSPWRVLSIFHIICAGIFALFSLKISDFLSENPRDKISAFMIILCGGAFLLFNHIEFYALPMIFSTLAYLLLIRDFKTKRMRFWFAIPALISALLHPLLIYLFSFPAVIFILRKFDKNGSRVVFALTFLAPLIVLLALKILGSDTYYLLFYNKPQYFFSFSHWLMVFNYLVFASPAILAVTFIPRHIDVKERFLLWGVVVSLIMAVTLRFDLGGGDCDLVSMLLFPLPIYLAYRSVYFDNKLKTAFVSAFCFLFFVVNILVGSNRTLELSRAKQLIFYQDIPMRMPFPGVTRFGFISSIQYLEFGDTLSKKEAYSALHKSIDEYPEDDRSYLRLAELYEKEGKPDLAESILIDGIGKTKEPRRIKLRLANFYKTHGEMEKGKKIFAELEKEFMPDASGRPKTDLKHYVNRLKREEEKIVSEAEKAFHSGDTSLARELYKRAIKNNWDIESRWAVITAYYTSTSQPDSAILYGKRGLFFDPDNPQIPYNMGIIYTSLNIVDSAIFYYRLALKIDTLFVNAHKNLGAIFAVKNECDSAIAHFRSAVLIAPDDWTNSDNLINCLLMCNEISSAKKEIEGFLIKFPDSPNYENMRKIKERLKNLR